MSGDSTQTLTIEPARRGGSIADAPHLFVALESARPFAGGARCCLKGVSTVSIGRATERSIELTRADGKTTARIGIPDSWMSTAHATLTRTPTGWMLEDAGSKNGVSVNGSKVERRYIEDGDAIELGRTFLILRHALPTRSEHPVSEDSEGLEGPDGFNSLLPPLAASFAEATKMAATTTASIAILGPTGSGKELCARALHQASARSGPLVAVNCAALADSVMESELFGYVEGAFSGANKDRTGLIASSSGGTLFLDELGELRAQAQAALLRSLQEREVRPVGSNETAPVDLRVISATHRPIAELAAGNSFREDLLARLSGFELHLPALADRREDLGHILRALLPRLTGEPDKVELTDEAARAYLAHDWPRNVRELEASVTRALTLGDGASIELEHLEPAIAGATLTSKAPAPEVLDAGDEARRRQLVELLTEHHGNVSAVAREMGALRQTVQKWIKRYGIDVGSFRV